MHHDPPPSRVMVICKRPVMIKLLYSIGVLTLLLLGWTLPALSEPYSPSCEIVIDKVFKARKALIPYQRSIELARASVVSQ